MNNPEDPAPETRALNTHEALAGGRECSASGAERILIIFGALFLLGFGLAVGAMARETSHRQEVERLIFLNLTEPAPLPGSSSEAPPSRP